MPIRYVAEFVGADADSERVIRWLILIMVLCCDPLAIALTAAASSQGTARQSWCMLEWLQVILNIAGVAKEIPALFGAEGPDNAADPAHQS